MTETELMRRLRADAVQELERVKVLDQRAATLNDMIRQYDEALAHKPSA